MVQDSNASCLDVALEAILIFADTYNQASQHSSEVAPGIVAKGLSGRPGTVTRAEEALLKFMEVGSHAACITACRLLIMCLVDSYVLKDSSRC